MADQPKTDSSFEAAVVFSLIFLLAMILGVLAFVPIPDKNQTLFTSLASGVVGAGVGAFLNFRWGSSASSKAKDDTISKMAGKDGE
jgi:uncharacterized membrane protein YeaQ/YmgE (transglycosylase-associated protein family)